MQVNINNTSTFKVMVYEIVTGTDGVKELNELGHYHFKVAPRAGDAVCIFDEQKNVKRFVVHDVTHVVSEVDKDTNTVVVDYTINVL